VAAATVAGALWSAQGAAGGSPAGGVRPVSRVVVIRDEPLAADAGDNPGALRERLDEAASALGQTSQAGDAWAGWFGPRNRVGVKVNCLGLPTRPALALGLAKALGSAEVAPERVVVWDRCDRELRAAGHELRAGGRGVRCYGTDSLGPRGNGGYAAEIFTSGRIGSLYSRIITDETDVLVSVPVLKDHNLAGLTCGMKNFYGAIHNPNKYHDDGCDPFIADVCAQGYVRERLRLVVCDALRPQYHGGPPTRPKWQWPYGGILMGTDPVAVDRVALEILERKRAAAGMKPLAAEGRAVRYLASAESRGLGTADLARIEVVSIGKPWLDVT